MGKIERRADVGPSNGLGLNSNIGIFGNVDGQ